MNKHITRRDFLNGVSLTLAGVTAANAAPSTATVQSPRTSSSSQDYYPPTLTGLRGSHDGSFEVAHELAWQGVKPDTYQETGENYDLVVVGGGISGLAAAYYYRKYAGEDKRILILDNHDDFGGHAKRNEFHTQGKMLLGFGGSQNFENPEDYGELTKGLLADLGINMDTLEEAIEPDYPLSSMSDSIGVFWSEGDADKIILGKWMAAFHGKGNYQALVQELPISAAEQEKIIDFIEGDKDYLDDLSLGEKYDYLGSTSYATFLRERVEVAEESLPLFDSLIRFAAGIGGDNLSVWEAIEYGAPGLRAMGWLGKFADSLAFDEDQPYKANFFPDGNASLARMLVRRLIPSVAEGNSMEDIVSARFNYQALDKATSKVRIRLNSTAVKVVNRGDQAVNVSYVRDGKPLQVRAKHAVLACYNGIIPHLCPELPDPQKEALAYGVKTPFVYVNVLLRTGAAFHKAGAKLYTCPQSYYCLVTSAPPVTLGDYRPSSDPNDPMVLLLGHVPAPTNMGDKSARDLFRIGRYALYNTPFSTYEAKIREQLSQMFGPHGFDADRDIEAITVNRWSHGYAYYYHGLYDPEWPEGEAPHEIGRQRMGRISIANSDSEATAYITGAIEAGHRAVKEQLSLT
ncbi:MAG: NAD(P)-binding protein [Pseudomonadota bacterium]